MKRIGSRIALVIMVMALGGCGVDVVGMAKDKAKEKIAALGVSGKTARYAAAEWLEKEAETKDFYTASIEPRVEDLYVLGCKGVAKQLRTQKEWYEVLLDITIGLPTLFAGNSALEAMGA